MTTQPKNQYAQQYLAALDRASLILPPERRSRLLEQVSAQLDAELDEYSDEFRARRVFDRLGEPDELVAEASADLPPASTRPSATELMALLLMGVGGVLLPLLAPAAGVLIMRTTPRWTTRDVRITWGILAAGLVGLVLGITLLAVADATNTAALAAGLLALGIVVIVGPAAALYAAFAPRP